MKGKITMAVFVMAVVIASGFSLPAEAGSSQNSDPGVVSGVGYPPIKAENPAQARLMARRAAILDAYRNVLSARGTAQADEQTFYTGLSGFVTGLAIEREEYLEDGGIRIIARVPSSAVTPRESRRGNAGTGQGPSPVPLNEWYRIIERSVRFQ